MNAPLIAVVLSCAAGQVAQAIRFLRVAQREHYLAGSATRFALRWWRCRPLNIALLIVAVAGAGAGTRWYLAGSATALACLAGPWGLSLRGRTSPLDWTRRLRVLALATLVIGAGIDTIGAWVSGALGGPRWVAVGGVSPCGGALALPRPPSDHRGVAVLVAGLLAVGAPLVVDAAMAITAPFERAASRRFVKSAMQKLARIKPLVVAITGSYGKTSTKNYVTHLLSARYSVLASPASFNNSAGLSRAVNENLVLGTDVFVAEMGTYGPGEIAAMCSWLTPELAVITGIGPVHLERMKSEDVILRAKTEITHHARVVVVNADDGALAVLANRLEEEGRAVRRASASDLAGADLPNGVIATNAACALAVARELGVDEETIARRVATLPEVPNRRTIHPTEKGVTVIDDTYNANPAGSRRALADLVAVARKGGRRVVVTPGMVEMGRRQAKENADFSAAVVAAGADLVVIGRTNRRALLKGAAEGARGATRPVGPVIVSRREDAVAWVREHLTDGDAVLYENDLPDHYP